MADLSALKEAIGLDPLAAGSVGVVDSKGVVILRRGMLITSLIALESFVRDRTTEILGQLAAWPASYQDLPVKFREAALLNALPNLQRFAKMLKRQEEDYESLLIEQIAKMSMTSGPVFGFSKFFSGDYTGNLSDDSLKSLLSTFQITDCWNSFRILSSEAGIGVPSVHELVKDVVRNRHKSAHSSDYVPTIADIRGISLNLTCIGLCFDAAMSASAAFALHEWQKWAAGNYSWRDRVQLYYIDADDGKFKLKKPGQARAVRVFDNINVAMAHIPAAAGKVSVLLQRDAAGRPYSWKIV